MLVAVWGALRSGNQEFVFYIVVMLVLVAGVGVIHARVRLTQSILWLLSIWGALHMAGGLATVPAEWPIHGELRVLYNWWIIPSARGASGEPGGWLKYDQAVHAFGFGVATWLCWQGLCGALRGRASIGISQMPRALNEVVEFVATRITETNVGGYVNTGWDLVYNTLGACVAAAIISLGSRRQKS